ncbi:sugar porter family MFS transporter [Algimonas porphyrae]|nr:sugar porter family MFS transporter [Algimonas porphyrae]
MMMAATDATGGVQARTSNPSLYFFTLVAALAGFLFGYDTGVIGGTQLYFTEYFQFTPGQQGFAVASAIYACIPGALVAGFLCNAISRKWTMIIAAVMFSVSAWGSGIADGYGELIIYRVIGGFAIGLASMAAPMLIAEIAPAEERGKLVSLNQLGIVSGFFVVFLATYFIGGGNTAGLSDAELVARNVYNTEQGWRVMFWSELLPSLAFFLALFFIPNSPRWLVMKGRTEDAMLVLMRLGANEATAQSEIAAIELSLADDTKKSLDPKVLAGLGGLVMVGVMLSVFQQVTGINAILYYGAEIFSNALGYGPEDALKQQLWLGAVNFLFTFIAIFTVDKWGRKPLLLTGLTGMFIGLSTLGLTVFTGQLGVLSLIGVLVFIASFALSMGPVVWVLISEIFPNRARSLAMAIAVGAQWLFNAFVSNAFPVVNRSQLNEQSFNGALPYFIFAGFCILAWLFVVKFVPETKGKSLEELEAGLV